MAESSVPEPKLGLFWGIPRANRTFRAVGLSLPASQVAEVGGFRTLDVGHVDFWPTVVRRLQELKGYPYEHFPRGRVNWRAEDDRYLLLLDRKLMTDGFLGQLRAEWCLPADQTDIMSDRHYRSSWRQAR